MRIQLDLAALEQRLPRQREAIRVQPAALEPEEDVARANRGAREHPVERHGTDRGTDQIEAATRDDAADHLADLRQLSSRAAHTCQLAAPCDAFSERSEQLGDGLLDRDVVDQRDRSCTDAQHVVDVHRDAVDADRVVAPGGLCDQELGPDAVGGDGDAQVVGNGHDVGEVPDVERGPGRSGMLERGSDPAQQRAEPAADGPHADIVLGERPHRPHPPRRVVWGPMRRRGAGSASDFRHHALAAGVWSIAGTSEDRKGYALCLARPRGR